MSKLSIKVMTSLFITFLIFIMTINPVFACTTIIVGKNKADDGSVMIAHSEELGDNAAQILVVVPRMTHEEGEVYESLSGAKIPQPKETYGYIASKIFDKEYYPGDITSGINEYQVSVANNMTWTREVPEDTAWDLIDGGIIWTEFTQLVLETAIEGIQLVGELCEKYRLSGDPGTAFGIADPNEGWFIEIAIDGQWIAKRVPDDGAFTMANCYRIGEVNLEDKNILHSPDLVDYAVSKGWYDPKSGETFNFSKVYGDPDNQVDEYNTLRHKMVDSALINLKKVSKEDLMKLMRSTYEGTDKYKADEKTGSPFNTGIRTISRLSTEISSVAQLRGWLPSEVGGVIWWNMGTSKTGVYVPWYYGTKEFPIPFTHGTNKFTDNSAYWTYFDLTKLVGANYKDVIDIVTKKWTEFEANEIMMQRYVDSQALELLKQNKKEEAVNFLTWYSNALGERSHEIAKELIRELKTITYEE